jgi:hypothetical protein
MGLNRNPHFALTAQRRLNRNQGGQETLQKPCFFDDFSSSTFLNPFLFPSSHSVLACKSTFYLHESTYLTTCLDCLHCSRLGMAEKTAPSCQKSCLCSCPFFLRFCSPFVLPSGSLLWRLSWLPWVHLGFPGLAWALLASPGSTW